MFLYVKAQVTSQPIEVNLADWKVMLGAQGFGRCVTRDIGSVPARNLDLEIARPRAERRHAAVDREVAYGSDGGRERGRFPNLCVEHIVGRHPREVIHCATQAALQIRRKLRLIQGVETKTRSALA
jgi:hypothetical protein